MRRSTLWWATLLMLGGGCDDAQEAPPPDAATSDARVDAAPLDAALDHGPVADATPPDARVDAAPPPPDAQVGCVDDTTHFADQVAPLLAADCVNCHTAEGPAAGSRHVLVPFDAPDAVATNHDRLSRYVRDSADGARLLVAKPTAQVAHGGGPRFRPDDPRAEALRGFAARVLDPGRCDTPPPLDCGAIQAGPAPLRRLTDSQLEHAVAAQLGVAMPPGLFPQTTLDADFRTWPVNNPVSTSALESILVATEHVGAQLDPAALLGCAPLTPECARGGVLALVERLWRRPLTADEAALAVRLLDGERPLDDAVVMAIEQALHAPQFLYLDGVTHDDAGPARPFDDHALAARMAFFLTDGPPDDALRAAADAGELRTREQIAAHARRLVQGAAVHRTLTRFHRDWLDLYRLRNQIRDPDRYPQYDAALVEAMRIEIDLFITEVVWGGAARLGDLLQSRATWVDSRLAALYGLPDPGPGWHRVTLGPDRPGVLTRLGFLTAHAHAAVSAPVQRGAFVLHELFCESLSPPPDVNMDLPEPTEEAPTVRERLQQHWTSDACSACHLRIDPIGFAFEHFGALGEWRDTWHDGHPVDAAGRINYPDLEFDGAAEFMTAVAELPQVRACYARRWLEYALGRGLTPTDQCSLDRLVARLEASGGDLRQLLVDVTLTDAFRAREIR